MLWEFREKEASVEVYECHHQAMKELRGGRRTSIFVLVLLLTSFFLFKYWLEDLWNEQFATNLFHPLGNPKETMEAASREKITKTKEITECSSHKICTSSSSSYSSSFPKSSRTTSDGDNLKACPFYFKWVRHDLRPWRKARISLEVVEDAKKFASFRLMIVNGRLFVESYQKCYQTRDLFTVWGILQLLELYPGMVPDLDLMFNCEDKPLISKEQYRNHSKPPPALFHYCGSRDMYDISFPDWSFWGWPELQIPPWETVVKEIQKGSQRVRWPDRYPTAYWRGNPLVSIERQDLLNCNQTPNWNGHLYVQDWPKESNLASQDSKLPNQCNHRYKIYIEGNAWSVSLKYILACDSPSLLITPKYHDFFLRGLIPQQHYWPIRRDKICDSINFAVMWGNNHTKEAMTIGKAGSDFVVNELKMKYVYDYMLHVLTEYAKLLKYKPSVTRNAVEYCSGTILCFANEAEKAYMEDSMVRRSSPSPPCQLGDGESHIKDLKEFFKKK